MIIVFKNDKTNRKLMEITVSLYNWILDIFVTV